MGTIMGWPGGIVGTVMGWPGGIVGTIMGWVGALWVLLWDGWGALWVLWDGWSIMEWQGSITRWHYGHYAMASWVLCYKHVGLSDVRAPELTVVCLGCFCSSHIMGLLSIAPPARSRTEVAFLSFQFPLWLHEYFLSSGKKIAMF